MASVGIIGGGPAGLAVAHDLSRAGHQVTLFEAAAEVGGLARSFQFGDIRIERYYHFICADDTGYFRKLRELAIEDKLRWKPTSMGFFYHGKLYRFSSGFDLLKFRGISIPGRFRYGLLVLYCSFVNHWRPLDAVRAETWLMSLLGRDTYMATWYPLLKEKFHNYHHQISAAWVWHRVRRVARTRKTPLHGEMLGHLEGGTDTLMKTLAAELQSRDATLLCDRPVKEILLDSDRAVGVQTADGQECLFDHVVSAVPLPILLRIAPHLPADYRTQLAAIDFIGVICATFRLKYSLTDNFWLNINDPRVPFNGCIEYTNLNPNMTPDGSTILYVPYYLPHSHERFSYSDRRLLQEYVNALAIINPDFSADWIIDYAVSRDPFAQVICPTGFAQKIPAHETPVRNLYLIESSQLYPADRNISQMFELADSVTQVIKGRTRSSHLQKARAAR